MRNVLCPYYLNCLDRAVQQNSAGWDCSSCRHRNDRANIGEIELERYQLLLWAIFKPDLYKKYRSTEAARAQAEKHQPQHIVSNQVTGDLVNHKI
jgi:hypothetical protein